MSNNYLLSSLWDILMEVAVRYSMFLIAVLSVMRAFSFVCPFRSVSKPLVFWVVVGYLALLILQETLPTVLLQEHSNYVPERLSCHHFGIDRAFTPLQTMIFKIFTFFIEIGAPMVVGAVTGIVCGFFLLREREEKEDRHEGRQRRIKKREATKTIMILTLVCIFLNLPITIISLLFTFEVRISYGAIMFGVEITTSMVMLNSVANSCIYFLRIKEMRDFVMRFLTCRKPLAVTSR